MIHQLIKRKLEALKLEESNFCARFGVSSIDQLPLVRMNEIALELGISPAELLNNRRPQKPFPADIQLLILDVDGVMTDGGMYFTENGDQIKKYNTKDGMGIMHLTRNGFQVGILSSGFTSEMVRKRAELLKIQHVYVGREAKMSILKHWCENLGISLKQVAMIGDDVNDLEIMQQIGYTACPSNAVNQILETVDYVLKNKGGEGCVREFIDEVMNVEVQYGAGTRIG